MCFYVTRYVHENSTYIYVYEYWYVIISRSLIWYMNMCIICDIGSLISIWYMCESIGNVKVWCIERHWYKYTVHVYVLKEQVIHEYGYTWCILHETYKGKVIGSLPECLRLVYEKMIGQWNYVECRYILYESHLWDSTLSYTHMKRIGQWTMWLRATSGILAISYIYVKR